MSITVNEFIKKMKEAFPNMEYKATDKNGRVFKSVGWDIKSYESKKNTTYNKR